MASSELNGLKEGTLDKNHNVHLATALSDQLPCTAGLSIHYWPLGTIHYTCIAAPPCQPYLHSGNNDFASTVIKSI